MITVENVTKRYGPKTAVENVSFTAPSGAVTGFLGPNGAGKSTTMRVIMGLDAPDGGVARVDGAPYVEHHAPLRSVGALLDAKAAHSGRSARNHLRAIAATAGIGRKRVDEVIGLTGLESVAGKRVGGFSLGMGQRLGIATALLGDPENLVLDEPVNGLDVDGVRWVRDLTNQMASEGRTVLLSSHLMSEVAQVADRVVVIGRGRILAEAPLQDFIARESGTATRVRTPKAAELIALLTPSLTVPVQHDEDGSLVVTGLTPEQIGEIAAENRIVLHEVSPVVTSLEDAYVTFTQGEVEYRTEGQS